jgi:chemosensory pili system protein ChpA (sensor histidine kinase/response regulator)
MLPNNKASEIKLQFLDEATDCLDTIEAGIVGLANAYTAQPQINTVLRAAHSIKGSAAMVGFQTLSDLAQSLEADLKLLKNNSQPIAPDLESLLLGAVGCMRQVVAFNRQQMPVDEHWLKESVEPLFEQMHLYVAGLEGFESSPAVDNSNLNPLGLIFLEETAGCLEHLSSVLAEPDHSCLFNEIVVVVAAIASVGEALQLNAIINFCESTNQLLKANEHQPESIEQIARTLILEVRQAQTLLSLGQVDALTPSMTQSFESPTDFPKKSSNSPRLYVVPPPKQSSEQPSDLKTPTDFTRETPTVQLDIIAKKIEQLTIQHQKLLWLAEQIGLELSNISNLVAETENNSDSLELENSDFIASQLPEQHTILVVDDSLTVRDFLSLTLEQAGYRVELAVDGTDALRQLQSGLQVHLIICDIDMPNMDGYGFLARLLSDPFFKHLPITMLTSRTGDSDRELAMSLGARAYFSKPFNEVELLNTLKQLID